MQFEDLGLIEPLLRAIRAEGYDDPTAIQLRAIQPILAGRDFLGCAQTGTGKTAAFALPILQRLSETKRADGKKRRPIGALVITPTRELAGQVAESFGTYGRYVDLRHTVVYGGVKQASQTRVLKKGVDILVATPGRLLDLMGQGYIDLGQVKTFVLDEVDRMLDMGFIDDIRKLIAKLPTQRQTLFFSATVPNNIRALAESILTDPVEVHVTPDAPAAETVEHHLYLVEPRHKLALLKHLLTDGSVIIRALVFTRTKRGADRLTRHLKYDGIHVEALHSDRPQEARQKAMAKFKRGDTRVLVASDIAARGLDVDDISHVINFDMPNEAETYVHRIGRTGRAGQKGKALSFCAIQERGHLEDIERLIRMPLVPAEDNPFLSPLPRASQKNAKARHRHGQPTRRRLLTRSRGRGR